MADPEADRVAGRRAGSGGAGRGTGVVPFRRAVRAWFAISLQTFGGPAGQIAVMQRELVEERRWIGQQRFNHALSYCMLLPGPEAQQLATYVGWLLNGVRGGLVAGTLFVLPGMLAVYALSAAYVAWGETAALTSLFAGLAPAVLAVVAQALARIARRSLRHPGLVAVAAGAFAALALFDVPFPLVIAAAALAGLLLGRLAPASTEATAAPAPEPATAQPVTAGEAQRPLVGDGELHHAAPGAGHTVRVLVVGLLLWGAPLLGVALWTGADSTLTGEGLFFSGAALITFGGAYAALAYVAQRAVEDYGWLDAGEMVRGLALAETTPGPLIMVVQFVAFLGAHRDPGALNPWLAATVGALLTTWVTFVPSFILVFLGAPYVERLRGNHTIASALAGITAAVVGVIGNLALYFALNTLFTASHPRAFGPLRLDVPDPGSLSPVALGITVAALVMTFGLRWPVLRVIGVCAALGLATALLPG